MSALNSVSITIDNLPSIAAAYSDGMAARALFEVWKRIDSRFEPDVATSEIEPWGVSLHFAEQQHGFSMVQRLEELLHEISTKPISVGSAKLFVALSIASAGSAEVLGNTRLDAEQFRRDMGIALTAYPRFHDAKIDFVEQIVANVDGVSSPLYHECLIRLRDVDGDLLMPGKFLPALERLGLMRAVDRQVVRAVLQELRRRPDAVLGCNISGMSVANDIWWHSILTDLRGRPDVACRLVIEITETVLPPNAKSALELIAALKLTGCRVAVDDFGSGYSTIAFARSALPDIVKLDCSFMRNPTANPSRLELLRHLVLLAGDFAPDVVIEGVETGADLQVAKQSGANWCQGYLFTPPAILDGQLYGAAELSLHEVSLR